MKKYIVFALIVLIATGSVFANNKEDATDTLTVSFPLGSNDNTHYEVGFSGGEVSNTSTFNENGLATPAKKKAATLALNANGTAADNTADAVWVYWNIIDAAGVDIELSIDSPLVGAEGNRDVIPWTVTWDTDGRLASPTEVSGEETTTVKTEIVETGAKGISSKQLTISTTGQLAGKTADTYTGTLTVRISSDGE